MQVIRTANVCRPYILTHLKKDHHRRDAMVFSVAEKVKIQNIHFIVYQVLRQVNEYKIKSL